MSEEELEGIRKRAQDIEKFRHIFADLDDWIERVEWEAVKNKHKELRDQFQKIYTKVNQVTSQYDLNWQALKSGDISKNQFERKISELIGELSIVDLELDDLKLKLYRFKDKVKDFIKEGGITEEEQKVLEELDEIYLLAEKELTISDIVEIHRIYKGKLVEPPIVKPKDEKKKRIMELSEDAQRLFRMRMYAEATVKWQEVLKLDSENRKAIEGIEVSKRILDKINELNISAQRLYDEGSDQAIDTWNEVLNTGISTP